MGLGMIVAAPVARSIVARSSPDCVQAYRMPDELKRSEERRVGKEVRYWRDWSSDVCSSDLDLLAVRRVDLVEGVPRLHVQVVGRIEGEAGLEGVDGAGNDRRCPRRQVDRGQIIAGLCPGIQDAGRIEKIGRASCRERGEILA